jgi:hypothetical protein
MKDAFLPSLADRFGTMGQSVNDLVPMNVAWGEWGRDVVSG